MKRSLLIVVLSVCVAACGSSRHGGNSRIIDPEPGNADGADASNLPEDPNGAQIVKPDVSDIGAGELDASAGLQPVFFKYDSYTILPDQAEVLQKDARILMTMRSHVIIEGHCDERGTEEYNLALGDRRARAVRDYLVNLGIGTDLLSIVSYGENKPFARAHNEAAWQENRRAQFVQPVSGKIIP